MSFVLPRLVPVSMITIMKEVRNKNTHNKLLRKVKRPNLVWPYRGLSKREKLFLFSAVSDLRHKMSIKKHTQV